MSDLELPSDSIELEFLRYWRDRLLDPADPQRRRWLSLELGQVDRAREIAHEISRFAKVDGARVLDVGCQTGALPIALSSLGAEVTGVDVDEALIEGARVRARCHGARATFSVAKAERLPFADGCFDTVSFVDVIEHVADARAAVREIARVLKPGGTLYLFGPNRLSPSLFLSDPHYQLAMVSAMPEALGRFYVTRCRRFPRYDVGVLPVGEVVARWLARDGLRVIDSAQDDAERWWRARAPTRLVERVSLARAYGRLRVSFAPLFRLVAVKQS